MDKSWLKMVPVIGDEKLVGMLNHHRKTTGLDYADTPEIMRYTFKCQIDSEKSDEIAETLINRLVNTPHT